MSATVMGWAALAMTAGGLIWWFGRMGRVRIPKNRAPFLVWMLAGGALGGFAIAEGGGWLTIAPAALAIAGASFVLLTVSISRQKVDSAIGVGDVLPPFQALDENGETFDSASLAGQPVLLKFFRGHW